MRLNKNFANSIKAGKNQIKNCGKYPIPGMYPENIAGNLAQEDFQLIQVYNLYNLNKNELRFQEIGLDSLSSIKQW